MKSKKRTVIILFMFFSLNLMVFGTIFQLFYSTAVTTTVIQEASNVKTEPDTTSAVIDSDATFNAVPAKSLYHIYISSKWSRITQNSHTSYLANQFVALNNAGLIINKYPASQSGTTKAATPLKTGPGVSYSDVIQLPLGKAIELIGEIVNTTGEEWLMYKYAYAVYYVAAKDIEIIPQTPTPATLTATTKPTTTSKPATTTKPTTPTTSTTPTTPITPSTTTPTPTTPALTNAQKIISLAYSKLGSAYVYGAVGPNAFDCSGFVYWVVNNSGIPGLSVPRTSIDLYNKYKSYDIGTSTSNAKPGDIILFSTNGTASGISHSAFYYTDGKIIHASTPSTGVIITSVAYSTTNKSIFAIIRLPGL